MSKRQRGQKWATDTEEDPDGTKFFLKDDLLLSKFARDRRPKTPAIIVLIVQVWTIKDTEI